MKVIIAAAIVLTLVLASWFVLKNFDADWAGVDETVVEKIAEEAGRPARDPFINTDGDLLLFVFLIAGSAGGFVAGYCFRHLFPPKQASDATNV